MMLPSSRTAQVVAQTGLDVSSFFHIRCSSLRSQAVIIDCEHGGWARRHDEDPSNPVAGNIDDRDMHDAVFAVAAHNVSPIVRIRGTDVSLIKRALDAGAQ